MSFSEFKDKNVLITGGLGFIGSNLARILVNYGANVSVVDSLNDQYGGNLYNIEQFKNKIFLRILDVRNESLLSSNLINQDYLFNLAGQTSHLDSMSNPRVDIEINAVSQISILECCRKYNPNIKIVYASTRQIYGKPQYLPVDENHPIKPVDVNGINKWSGEAYHILYHEVYGIKSCSLRLTNTYGPNMRIKDARQTFLGIWFRNVIERNPLIIFGDGNQLRDFNYVDDVVNAMLICALKDESNGEIYNLGSDEVVSLNELAHIMEKIAIGSSHRHIDFPEDRKRIDIGDYYSDFKKIKLRFGWTPKETLESGLAKTFSFFLSNYKHYI